MYYDEAVRPAIATRWPGLPHAAARLGGGSEVLGFDDAVSRDHDWGPRLNLFVPVEVVGQVDDYLDTVLPETFGGYLTRFAVTWDPQARHRVQVGTVGNFVASRTGVNAFGALSIADWMSLTGQAILEVTAGPVYVDTTGELTSARERLAWYPEGLWTYVVATDWVRLAQELPLVGRTPERGDALGSRVITARLVGVAIHLAHLLERRWPPYPKWAGTSLSRLPRAGAIAAPLHAALEARDWRPREDGLVEALRRLHQVQRAVGLPVVEDPIEPFWARGYQGVRDDVVARLEASVTDPAVRALPRGVGSVEQWSDNVDVLLDTGHRLASHGCGEEPAETR